MAITIREFGTLATGEASLGLDHQRISQSNFNILKSWALEARAEGEREVFRLISRYNQECIQVQNYVGLIALPNGEQLEILPKITDGSESIASGRRLLLKMLSIVHNLHYHQSGIASLETLSRPWIEALIKHVLQQIARLTRSGLKKRYTRVQRELPVIKGQLLVSKQVRQRPGKEQFFHVAYDEYNLNRAENRLLKSAVLQLSKWSQSPDNQRLSRELMFVMDVIPVSTNKHEDFQMWSTQRDMVLYQPLLPWIKLILKQDTPIFGSGPWEGVSLLFPMERLFEEYVSVCLASQINSEHCLKTQASSKYLVTHRGRDWFNLRPDILIRKQRDNVAVLDTKWKLLDSDQSSTDKKYGLSQNDFYQMFAYSEKYLEGSGTLVLIYPRTDKFKMPLPEFSFGTAKLLVLPFDLERNALITEGFNLEFLESSTKQKGAK